MRRAIPILLATAFGLALLLNFRTSPGPTAVTTPDGTKASSPATRSTPPAGASPPAKNGTTRVIDGSVEHNVWGDVQVRVTFSGLRIVEVEPLELPVERPRSAQITYAALPTLHQEVLQAQSAKVQTVSGATFTSDGYKQSLQAAIDQLAHR